MHALESDHRLRGTWISVLRRLPYLGVFLTGAWNAIFYWPICGASLSKANVGELGSTLAIASVLSPLLLLSINVYITRELADVRTRESALVLASGIRLFLISAFFLALAGWILSNVSVTYLVIVSQAALVWSLSVSRGLSWSLRYFWVAVLGFSLIPTVAVLLGVHNNLDVNRIIVLQSVVIFFASMVALGKPSVQLSHHILPNLKTALRTTGLGTVNLVGTVALFQGGRVLVTWFDGHDAAAEFQFATSVGVGMLTAMIVISDAVLPSYYGFETNRWLSKINGINRTLSILSIPATAGLALSAYGITRFVCPVGYPAEHIAVVASVIVLGACPVMFGTLAFSASMYLRRGNILAAPTIFSVMLGLVLVSSLQQEIGIRVAFAMVVSLGVRTIIQSHLCTRLDARLHLVRWQLAPIMLCILSSLVMLLRFGSA